jgi:uncharacterized repeat protein (TIGR03803 family)
MSAQERGLASVSVITLVLGFLVVSTIFAIPAVQAQTYTVLHAFTGGSDGGNPYAGLTLDGAGNLYGATAFGGLNENGVVYKLKRAGSGWVLSTLYEFQGGEDGEEPIGGITIGPDGAFYGTTLLGGGSSGCAGGCGIVYRLTPPATVCRSVSCPWTETVLHRFGLVNGDGAEPVYGSPVFDRAGNLYGTTSYGGTSGHGTVYELSPSSGGWTETILWSFTGRDDGGLPLNSLIFDGAGNLYGTASDYGNQGSGTVFELSPSGSVWIETTLFSFTFPGTGRPIGGLAWDAQDNLYGTTGNGGPYDYGTVFQLTPSAGGWTFNQLTFFLCCGGPQSTPTLDNAGNVYVTVVALEGDGAIVKLNQSQGTWTSTILHLFTGSDGYYPYPGVALDANGNLYGTTYFGGGGNCPVSCGVIYEITP